VGNGISVCCLYEMCCDDHNVNSGVFNQRTIILNNRGRSVLCKEKLQVVPVLNKAPWHKDVCRSGGTAPCNLNLST
jgi:hypothetical protein